MGDYILKLGLMADRIEQGDIQGFKDLLNDVCDELSSNYSGLLVFSRIRMEDKFGPQNFFSGTFSRIIKGAKKYNKFPELLDIFEGELGYKVNLDDEKKKKKEVLRLLKVILLQELWHIESTEENRAIILNETKRIENSSIEVDFYTLFELKALYENIGEEDKARIANAQIKNSLSVNDVKIFTEISIASIGDELQKLNSKIDESSNTLSTLEVKQAKLKEGQETLERDKIRLIETLGLFAAIIAFVIAGVLGLHGMSAASIAITLTGLTASLTVLVMLINIFTSPRQYVWGKVAVLGIAFLILVGWVCVTVCFKTRILFQ